MTKSALLISTTIGLSLALATGVSAAPKHSTTTVAHVGKLPALTLAQGKLKGSAVGSGVYGATAPSGDTTLDTESVNCKSKSGTCELAMSAMVQQCSIEGAFAPDLYAVNVTVDGNEVDFGPYAGGTQTAHVCDISNWQGIYPVSAGTHTVVFQTYESSPTYVAQWSDRTDVVTQ
jgi:hypothetical protein